MSRKISEGNNQWDLVELLLKTKTDNERSIFRILNKTETKRKLIFCNF